MQFSIDCYYDPIVFLLKKVLDTLFMYNFFCLEKKEQIDLGAK